MKKVCLLLAATVIGSPLLLNSQAYAITRHKTTAHHHAVTYSDTGTVTMTFHSADLGVGYTWGDGVLHYRGKSYKFKIKGGDVVAVGFSKSQARGQVTHLTNLYDFAGHYAAATGEATAGVGVGAGSMKNAKNVIINIDTNTMGGRLAGAPAGFEIKFADKHLQKAAENNAKQEDNHVKAGKSFHRTGHETADDLNGQELNQLKK